MIHTRPYQPEDRAFILGLAPRLAAGRPAWRDADAWARAVDGWLSESIAQHPAPTMVIVAVDEGGAPLGFASVAQHPHFTGQPQAYILELAVSAEAEGRGAGRALVEACADWARGQRLPILALTARAANARALALYHHLGFVDEDVTLVRLLEPPPAE